MKPTPETINNLAQEFVAKQEEIRKLEEELRPLRQTLIGLVTSFGQAPPRAEKSVRLESDAFELTVSIGSSVSVDKVGIARLQAALARAGCAAFFKKLFRRDDRYLLACSTKDLLGQQIKRPANAPRNLVALFHRCLKFEPTAPQLTVKAKGSVA